MYVCWCVCAKLNMYCIMAYIHRNLLFTKRTQMFAFHKLDKCFYPFGFNMLRSIDCFLRSNMWFDRSWLGLNLGGLENWNLAPIAIFFLSFTKPQFLLGNNILSTLHFYYLLHFSINSVIKVYLDLS